MSKIKRQSENNETILGKNGLMELKITGKVPERMQIDAAKGCEGLIYQQRARRYAWRRGKQARLADD